MNPNSSLGFRAGRGRWVTGGALASLALALAGVAVTGGAAVASPRADDMSATTIADEYDAWVGEYEDRVGDYQDWAGDYEGQGYHKRWWQHHDRPDNPTNPAGCADIDSYAPSNAEEFSAVVSNGVTYAGRRDLQPDEGPYTWLDLSGNEDYPGASVCGVAISSQGNDAWVKVLTTTGEVWQTHCDVTGTTFVCEEDWVQQTTPTPAP